MRKALERVTKSNVFSFTWAKLRLVTCLSIFGLWLVALAIKLSCMEKDKDWKAIAQEEDWKLFWILSGVLLLLTTVGILAELGMKYFGRLAE